MLAHVYDIIIYQGVGTPGHVRDVVYGINATDKQIVSMLMENVQFPGSKVYDYKMEIYSTAYK